MQAHWRGSIAHCDLYGWPLGERGDCGLPPLTQNMQHCHLANTSYSAFCQITVGTQRDGGDVMFGQRVQEAATARTAPITASVAATPCVTRWPVGASAVWDSVATSATCRATDTTTDPVVRSRATARTEPPVTPSPVAVIAPAAGTDSTATSVCHYTPCLRKKKQKKLFLS